MFKYLAKFAIGLLLVIILLIGLGWVVSILKQASIWVVVILIIAAAGYFWNVSRNTEGTK